MLDICTFHRRIRKHYEFPRNCDLLSIFGFCNEMHANFQFGARNKDIELTDSYAIQKLVLDSHRSLNNSNEWNPFEMRLWFGLCLRSAAVHLRTVFI